MRKSKVVTKYVEKKAGATVSDYTVSEVDTGNPNLTVAVRIRPENDKEIGGKWRSIIKVLDEHVLVFDPAQDRSSASVNLNSSLGSSGRGFTSHFHRARDYKYAFDRVFDQHATQQEVYAETTAPLIQFVLNGFNATVFAYGATGSGKTHTMIGNEEAGPGVMVLTMRDLFEKVEQLKHEKKFKISISYLEIYNETIRDLFVENSPPLMLCEDSDSSVRVPGLTERYPKTAEEVFELLEYGNKQRRQSPTTANEVSSRSHAVLQILVKQKDRTADVSAAVKIGKLSLIDLAGSERAAVSQNKGERLKEGANINKSLLALGNCINSLGENYRKGKHVPYRNSKLTRLLKDSLGGNTRTVMIAAISPSNMCYEDTLNTLKYANRAKNIKTKVTRNVVNVNYHISKYTQIIADLRNEVQELKSKLAASNIENVNPNTDLAAELDETKRQVHRLQSNLCQMREIVKEQYQILQSNGLVTEAVSKHYLQANQLCSPLPGWKVKQAWVPQKLNLTSSAQRVPTSSTALPSSSSSSSTSNTSSASIEPASSSSTTSSSISSISSAVSSLVAAAPSVSQSVNLPVSQNNHRPRASILRASFAAVNPRLSMAYNANQQNASYTTSKPEESQQQQSNNSPRRRNSPKHSPRNSNGRSSSSPRKRHSPRHSPRHRKRNSSPRYQYSPKVPQTPSTENAAGEQPECTPMISRTSSSPPREQEVYLLTPKSPSIMSDHKPVICRSVTKNPRHNSHKPKSILKKTEANVDKAVYRAKSILIPKQEQQEQHSELSDSQKSVIFAISPNAYNRMNAKAVNGKENKNPTKRSSVIDAARASRDKKNANDPANNNSKIAKKKTSAAGYLYAGDKENVRTSIPKPASRVRTSAVTHDRPFY